MLQNKIVEQYEPYFDKGYDYTVPVQVGQKIRLFYDVLDRPTQTLNPDGTAQLSVYGTPAASPNFTQATSGRIKIDYTPTPWETYAYDANDLGGITHPTESSSYSSHWDTPESSEIDALGRTIKTIQRLDSTPANDIVMQYEYDIQGRLTKVTDPLSRDNFIYLYATVAAPKGEGNKQTPPEAEALSINHLDSGVTEQVFDARSQLIESIDAKQSGTLWAYEERGMPKRTWMAAVNEDYRITGFYRYGNTSQKVNNQVGRPTHSFDESGFYYNADYDFKGNLLKKEHRFINDELLEGTSRFKVDWLNTHNPNNDTGAVFETNYGYDALNRLVVNALPEDVDGDHKKIYITYSRSGALSKVTLGEEEYVKEIAYNAKGQRLLISFGNGVMNRYTYDPKNFRLLRMKAEKYTFSETATERTYAYNSGTNRQDLGYEYDLNGNILKKKNRTPDCGINGSTLGVDALDNQYAYDAISRLLSASGRESDANNESHRWADAPVAGSPNANNTQTYTRSYTYDKVGNIQSLQQTGSNAFTREFEYTVNTLDDITVSGTSTSFNYDANGNLVSSGSSRYYEWNEKDQLTFFKIDAGGGPSVYAHYLYDSGGNRVKKIVWDQQGNKEVTVYIDGIFEYRLKQEDSTDKEQNIIHVMDDSARIAQVRIGTEFNDDISETVHYVLDDHLGSSTTRLDATGSVIDRQEYYPFGDTSLRTYSKKRYRYFGKEKDSESGLYYFGKRFYSPWLCRFISVDPSKEQRSSLTPYNYVQNNPINLTDPDGGLDNGGGGDPPPVDSDLAGSPNQGNTTTEKTQVHSVEKGDTISGLAEQYGVSQDSIREANPQTQGRKQTDQINIGEELKIPSANENINSGGLDKSLVAPPTNPRDLVTKSESKPTQESTENSSSFLSDSFSNLKENFLNNVTNSISGTFSITDKQQSTMGVIINPLGTTETISYTKTKIGNGALQINSVNGVASGPSLNAGLGIGSATLKPDGFSISIGITNKVKLGVSLSKGITVGGSSTRDGVESGTEFNWKPSGLFFQLLPVRSPKAMPKFKAPKI